MSADSRRVVRPLILPALLVGVWAAAVTVTRSPIFPTPWHVAVGLVELGRSGLLVKHVTASLFRVTYGYFLAASLAIPLGVWIGTSHRAHDVCNPVIQLLRPISPIAWIPLAILWFGIGDLSPIFLIFLSSFFPIVVGTVAGVRAIEQRYLRAAQNFGLRGVKLVSRVVLPAALPQIVTGLRIGLGVAWLVVVAAEMIAVNSGLGFQIIDARNTGTRYDLVVAGMIVIGLIGLALDRVMRSVEHLDEVRWWYEA
jgi:NitT/TauT family transport system permease protein